MLGTDEYTYDKDGYLISISTSSNEAELENAGFTNYKSALNLVPLMKITGNSGKLQQLKYGVPLTAIDYKNNSTSLSYTETYNYDINGLPVSATYMAKDETRSGSSLPIGTESLPKSTEYSDQTYLYFTMDESVLFNPMNIFNDAFSTGIKQTIDISYPWYVLRSMDISTVIWDKASENEKIDELYFTDVLNNQYYVHFDYKTINTNFHTATKMTFKNNNGSIIGICNINYRQDTIIDSITWS